MKFKLRKINGIQSRINDNIRFVVLKTVNSFDLNQFLINSLYLITPESYHQDYIWNGFIFMICCSSILLASELDLAIQKNNICAKFHPYTHYIPTYFRDQIFRHLDVMMDVFSAAIGSTYKEKKKRTKRSTSKQ